MQFRAESPSDSKEVNFMRKISLYSILFVLTVVFFSCGQIPSIPSSLPVDPDYSEPASWGNDVDFVVTIDKSPYLVPIGAPDHKRIKVSFINYEVPESVNEDNFMVFEDGKAQGFALFKESEVRSVVDIVFLIDVTGSMGKEIEGVKNSITNFLTYLKNSGLDVRVAIVPFGDYAPADETTTDGIELDPRWLDFSDTVQAQEYVDQLTVGWGGDAPENSYGAILYAWNNATWRSGSNRILILLTDAFSHYEGDDGYSEFEPKTTKDELTNKLKGYATLYMVASTYGDYLDTDADFSGEGDPREIAVETGGMVIYQSGDEEVDLSSIGITDAILNTYVIIFESNSPGGTHEITVYYNSPSGEKGSHTVIEDY